MNRTVRCRCGAPLEPDNGSVYCGACREENRKHLEATQTREERKGKLKWLTRLATKLER